MACRHIHTSKNTQQEVHNRHNAGFISVKKKKKNLPLICCRSFIHAGFTATHKMCVVLELVTHSFYEWHHSLYLCGKWEWPHNRAPTVTTLVRYWDWFSNLFKGCISVLLVLATYHFLPIVYTMYYLEKFCIAALTQPPHFYSVSEEVVP